MKHNNMIDLTGYFVQQQTEAENVTTTAVKVLRMAGRTLEVAATAAIALCVCTCTLLFFTML